MRNLIGKFFIYVVISGIPATQLSAHTQEQDKFSGIGVFTLGMVGFVGGISSQERLYRKIKETSDASGFFNQIVKSETATIESKIYAMCGLRDLDRKSFDLHKGDFLPSSTISTMKGDVLSREKVDDVLYRIEVYGCN